MDCLIFFINENNPPKLPIEALLVLRISVEVIGAEEAEKAKVS